MHAVCLGVCKRLVGIYVNGGKGQKLSCKLSVGSRELINARIKRIRPFIPNDFQRRLRGLNYLEQYKATEFRQILLYLGPYLFVDVLPKEFYDHFVYLHFAIYCLCTNETTLIDSAHACIEHFCSNLEIYNGFCSSYNFHVILHLSEFVRKYGNLKRRIKPTRHILQHSVSQGMNLLSLPVEKSDLIISNKVPDNCFQTESGIISVQRVNDDGSVTGRKFSFLKNLYDQPYPSLTLDIGSVSYTHLTLPTIYSV